MFCGYSRTRDLHLMDTNGFCLRLLFVVFCAFAASGADLDSRATLFYDSGIPQVSFAAAEIRGEEAMLRGVLTERSLAYLAKSEDARRYVIASGPEAAASVAAALGIAAPRTLAP